MECVRSGGGGKASSFAAASFSGGLTPASASGGLTSASYGDLGPSSSMSTRAKRWARKRRTTESLKDWACARACVRAHIRTYLDCLRLRRHLRRGEGESEEEEEGKEERGRGKNKKRARKREDQERGRGKMNREGEGGEERTYVRGGTYVRT